MEFLKILPQTRKIIDTGNSCAEKTIMEARCSLFYDSVIFKLTWTKSDVNAPINLGSGFRVRITADRKVRYTLLLGLPFLISLKLKKWLLSRKIVSLGNGTHSFRSTLTHTDKFQKRKRHRHKILSSFHFQKVQPAYAQSIKLYVCIGAACNAFHQFL